MMKKLLAILLSMVLLLSLAACGKTEVPKEDDKLGTSVDDKKPDDSSIPFESGILPTHVGAFYDDVTLENYDERKDEIPDVIVTFLETSEQCNVLLDAETVELIQAQSPEDRTPLAQQAVETLNKYTDVFWAGTQVIAITRVKFIDDGSHLEVKELIQNEDGKYHLVVGLKYDDVATGSRLLHTDTLTVEIDKSLGITSENLTVELIK